MGEARLGRCTAAMPAQLARALPAMSKTTRYANELARRPPACAKRTLTDCGMSPTMRTSCRVVNGHVEDRRDGRWPGMDKTECGLRFWVSGAGQ